VSEPSLSRPQVEDAVRVATSAPSILNVQPWRFVARGAVVELHVDPDRALPALDPLGRAATVSCGAALCNLALAVAVLGRRPVVQLLPSGPRTSLLATVTAGEAAPPTAAEVRLHAATPSRRTSRVPFLDQPLAPEVVVALEAAARVGPATLRLLGDEELDDVLRLVRQADEAQRKDPAIRAEVAHWVGQRRTDGIPAAALGPVPRDDASAGLVRDFAMGLPVRGRESAQYEQRPSLGLLLTPGDDPAAWLRAGQALERVWLEATAAGLAVSLLTQPLELSHLRWLARRPPTAPVGSAAGVAGQGGAAGAPEPGVPELAGESATERLWPQALLRLGPALRSTPPTPRRPLPEVLTFR
jgi:nitroreductase